MLFVVLLTYQFNLFVFHTGEYRRALHYHRIELSLSEAGGDRLGAAIAHRKVGECECELGNYGPAIEHQTMHLKIAQQLGGWIGC